MAINDYGIRFTEEKYATKNEVARELKMSMVDPIWSPILKYRTSFNRYLPLKTIEHNSLVICFCSTISNSFNELDKKLLHFMSEYINATHSEGNDPFASQYHIECLKSLANKNKIDLSISTIKTILSGYTQSFSNDNQIAKRYFESLMFLKTNRYHPIDSDFILNLYRLLSGESNLTSFYRISNNEKVVNHVLIDHLHSSAPTNMLKNMFESLLSFIDQSNVASSIKALITYYYVNYIKPFPSHNDEMALLLAKSILSHDQLGDIALFIPLERFFDQKIEELSKVSNEVQKTNDLTYYLVFAVKFVDSIVQEMLDKLVNFAADSLKTDFYNEEKEIVSQPVIEETPVIKKEIIEPKIVEPAVKISEPLPNEAKKERLAVSFIPSAIDEKEATRLELHLLECDPLLSKKQAKFYARHCTLGKMYTIQQFKKYNNCVYETARVGMDALAGLGYYKKEQIKNKFVYTPIERK